MASRLNLARVGAAVLGASAALLLAAAPATAATPHAKPKAPAATPVTNVTVDSDHNKDNGSVDLVGLRHAPTGLLALAPAGGGADLFAYCVQIGIDEGDQGTGMHQAPWSDYPDPTANFNSDSGKVNWILHNSFPVIALADVSTAAKTPTTLSPIEAVEGTQAAIWHFSDNTDLDTHSHHNDANVVALYQYLVGNAVELPQPPDNPTLSITAPAKTTGDAGTKIGPFTVDTNLQLVQLTKSVPAGVTLEIVDAAGHAVDADKVVDGTRVFFDVPGGTAEGDGSFTVSGGLQVGQMFVGGTDVNQAATKPRGLGQFTEQRPIQTLILAQGAMLSAQGSAKWVTPPVTTTTTAPPMTTTSGGVVPPTTTTTTPGVTNVASSGSLPFTGVNVLAPVVLSIVLIGAGGAFLLVQRRRKRA